MADFSTSVALSFEIDDAELRAARDDIESELGGVSVDVDAGGAGSAVPDGGLDMGTLTDLADERNDILDDILDELESGTFGGGGGGGGLPIPGFGGGGDGGGFGLLEALGAGSLARLLPAISGGTAAAAGAGAGLPLIGGAIAKRFGGAPSIASGALTQSPLFALLASGAGAAGALSNFDLGAGGVTPGAGGPGPDVGAGIGEPSPEFQRLIEQFDSAVSQTPAWLSRLERTVQRLTSDAAPTPTDPGPRGRFAGRPSGSERGLSAAERAIFSGGRQPTGSGGTTVGGVPTGFQSVDGGGGDSRDSALEARLRNQPSAEVTVNADVNLDNLEAELGRFRDDVLNEVDRRLRDLNGGPGR